MTPSNPEESKSIAPLHQRLQKTLPDAHLEVCRLPFPPGLQFWLLRPDNMDRRFSRFEMHRIMERPPYWAFCWASGQALARMIAAEPHRVSGRVVLDFGAGSGVAAIAAARAGATQVIACDQDLDALEAVKVNARLNNVQLTRCASLKEMKGRADVLLAADVLYDRANIQLLPDFLKLADQVLVADSRVKNLEIPGYRTAMQMNARTLPDLGEPPEHGRVWIYADSPRRTQPQPKSTW